MFLRRRGIQPDAIDDMHLFDILLEIMEAVDPIHDPDHKPSAKSVDQGDGRWTVEPKPGQSTAQALRAKLEAEAG